MNQGKQTPPKSLGDQLKDANERIGRFERILIFLSVEILAIISYLIYNHVR